MHGLGVKNTINMSLVNALEMMRFLCFEGKADIDGNGKPISSFEYRLYNACYTTMLNSTKYQSIELNFLIGIVLSEMDSYNDSFIKVRKLTK